MPIPPNGATIAAHIPEPPKMTIKTIIAIPAAVAKKLGPESEVLVAVVVV